MDPSVFDDAWILTGPTASGKTAVGLALAESLGAEIIAMDSMTLFRGMDIGTAKPTVQERQSVPHYLLDVLDPWESASFAWWLQEAARCCQEIRSRGRRVLFVGGTPLYLKGLLRGLFEGPAADMDLRRRLEGLGGPALHARLKEVDPPTARRLHPNDLRRLVRALEVHELTGRPLSDWQQQHDRPRPRARPPIWLDLPRTALYARINLRVERMMGAGLLDEVRRLLALPRPPSREARQALGYKEIIDYLEGRTASLAQAVERCQTRSRNFAKRQLTWFRNLAECQRLAIADDEPPAAVAARFRAAMPPGDQGPWLDR